MPAALPAVVDTVPPPVQYPPVNPPPSGPPATVLRIGRCEVRLLSREIMLEGQLQPVRPKVFDLLVLLVEQRPRVVPREELMRKLWKRTAMSGSVLAHAVLEARRAIGDSADGGDQPRLITTVHGVGYRFDGKVVALSPQTPPAPAAPAAKPAEPAPSRSGGAGPGTGAAEQAIRRGLDNAADALDHGDPERAERDASQAAHQAVATGLPLSGGEALVLLAHAATLRGDGMQAAQHALAARRLAQQHHDPLLQARARTAMAGVALLLDQPALALAELDAAWPAACAQGHAALRAQCERLLAQAYGDLMQPDTALAWCRASRATAATAGLPALEAAAAVLEASLRTASGDTLQRDGQTAEADTAWRDGLAAADTALAAAQRLGMLPPHVHALVQRGNLLSRLGRHDDALRALALCRMLQDRLPDTSSPARTEREAQLSLALARAHQAAGQVVTAQRTLDQAIGPDGAMPAVAGLLPLLQLASTLAEGQGQLPQALRLHRRLHRLTADLRQQQEATLARLLPLQTDLERQPSEPVAAQAMRSDLAAAPPGAASAAGGNSPAGLPQPRPWLQQLHQAHRQARDTGTPLCLALIGVDGLDHTAPHEAAARLQHTARMLREHSRTHDLPVRHGDAAFALMITGVGTERIGTVCERLRQAVAREGGPNTAGRPPVTVSIAWHDLALAPDAERGLEDLAERLRAAMRRGIDQVLAPA